MADETNTNTKVLNYAGLTHYNEKIKETYVAKETGKGLSTNDFTTEEKEKLASLSQDAETAKKLATARKIAISGASVGEANFDGSSDITIETTLSDLDAAKITTGTIDIARLPAAALERLVVVADDTARFALTNTDIQLGDTVKVTSTGKMYLIKDESKLATEDGYEEYTAGQASSVPWGGVTDKPETFTPSAHTQASDTITAMTGYTKAETEAAIAPEDSLNVAIGKLEKVLDGKGAPYVLPAATAEVLGDVIIGDNITLEDTGNISVSKENVVAALGYTPSNEAEVITDDEIDALFTTASTQPTA